MNDSPQASLALAPTGDASTGLAVVPANPMELLTFAVQSKTDVETLERLTALAEKFQARQAKERFDAAMAAFQSECPIIKKRKCVVDKNGRLRYKYAPLDDIVEQIKHLLDKHGFSFSINSAVTESRVKAICTIKHRGGHSEPSEFEVPIDSDAYMSLPQRAAAALTFASRYAFRDGFGILTTDEDTDAQSVEKPKGPSSMQPDTVDLKSLAQALWTVLKPVRGEVANWKAANQYMWDENIIADTEEAPHLTAERFRAAIAISKERLQK